MRNKNKGVARHLLYAAARPFCKLFLVIVLVLRVMGASLSYPTVSLTGKVALVTGANTGIGYETAKAVAGMGAHTFVACRSLEKATACVERMKGELATEREGQEVRVEGLEIDLGSFRSTRACADTFKAKNLPLHILINNAGVLAEQLTRTEDGHEIMYQVNHLSPFLLTLELLPTLEETAAAMAAAGAAGEGEGGGGGGGGGDCRVVWVASTAHEGACWEPNNIDSDAFHRMGTYRNSKLYNVMTAFSMQRRVNDKGITVSSLHPGVIKSELWRNMAGSSNIAVGLFGKLGPYFMRGVKEGAATTINCAVNPELKNEECVYYADCSPKQPSVTARNEGYQEELWGISIEAIKQYLSPEVLERYGAAISNTTSDGSQQTSAATAGDVESPEQRQPAEPATVQPEETDPHKLQDSEK